MIIRNKHRRMRVYENLIRLLCKLEEHILQFALGGRMKVELGLIDEE